MKRFGLITLACVIAAPANAAAPINGKWLTQDGKGIVEIAPCGAQICGKLVKLLADTHGPPNDRNNPNPALRTRPLMGMNILSAFKDSGKQWEGRIYSPERGKEYRSVVFRSPDGTLTVKGCISFICETQIWKPVR